MTMASSDGQGRTDETHGIGLLRRELDELRAEKAALEEKVQARDNFIAVAGHEMRNHMNALQIHAGLILRIAGDGGAPATLTEKVGAMRRATTDFVRRSTAVLDVGRLNSGSLRLDLESVDLGAIVREVLSDWAPVAEVARCTIDVTCEDEIRGLWDRMAIEQVVTNLVSNAIKFGPGKAIDIRVAREGDVARPRGARLRNRDLRRRHGSHLCPLRAGGDPAANGGLRSRPLDFAAPRRRASRFAPREERSRSRIDVSGHASVRIARQSVNRERAATPGRRREERHLARFSPTKPR